MADSIIQGITDYFLKCPLLADGEFHLDALGEDPGEYVVETGVFNPTLRTYVDGTRDCQYQFNFGSREIYSMDRMQNIMNSSFYEELSQWVFSQNIAGNFPEMPAGCEPYKMECMTNGYIMDGSLRNARYQIQMRILYTDERRS